MPTTDDNDRYDEQHRRQEADQAQLWNTIFTCVSWIGAAILVLAFLIALSR